MDSNCISPLRNYGRVRWQFSATRGCRPTARTTTGKSPSFGRPAASASIARRYPGRSPTGAELGKLLKALTAGDVAIVSRLDRLARSTLDLLTILRRVTEAGAKFRSLKDPWADTTTPHGELMVTILAGLATFERHLIKARTDDGRKAAQARGVRFGRPPKLTAFQRQEALQRLANGETQADVARAYNVDPAAICRLAAAGP